VSRGDGCHKNRATRPRSSGPLFYVREILLVISPRIPSSCNTQLPLLVHSKLLIQTTDLDCSILSFVLILVVYETMTNQTDDL
jgi:hypothetical protein